MVAPSGGAERPGTLRRLNAPRGAHVRVDDAGVPVALRRDSGWLRVIELLDRYRTDDRWWTEQRVARMYYELHIEDGRTVTVFHDEAEDSWHEQRYG